MPRTLLITNPAAARTDHLAVEAVVETLRSGGWTVELRATGGPGDARRFTEEAVRDKLDVVTVFGGDGTTMQAAAALVGTTTSLGIIPGGTGNLLAGNLRIPTNPVRAARALLAGAERPLDLGKIEREDGTHYFAVAGGAGYDARVMAETSTADKHRWRIGAYWATTFRLMPELQAIDMRITIDGVEYESRTALVLVANCGEMIPRVMKLRHDIVPDDGLLDVVVVHAETVGESLKVLWDVLRSGGRNPDVTSRLRYGRGQVITVETPVPHPVQLDGEPHGKTPFTASVVPGAIRIMAPKVKP
jgi:YegS/Rv2252/BmrU family lipid kinase